MDLRRVMQRDWLLLNSGGVRNALVAAAETAQTVEQRREAERLLRERQNRALRRVL